jgi:hypothetical protein
MEKTFNITTNDESVKKDFLHMMVKQSEGKKPPMLVVNVSEVTESGNSKKFSVTYLDNAE